MEVRRVKTVVEIREYTAEDLCEALGLPVNCEVYVCVPGGGEYSNCTLNIDKDVKLTVEIRRRGMNEKDLTGQNVRDQLKDCSTGEGQEMKPRPLTSEEAADLGRLHSLSLREVQGPETPLIELPEYPHD